MRELFDKIYNMWLESIKAGHDQGVLLHLLHTCYFLLLRVGCAEVTPGMFISCSILRYAIQPS
jgi:hypothetical protein